ncbi:MAG: hypothetical protein ABUS54_10240 [Actinomycetota bacterium]
MAKDPARLVDRVRRKLMLLRTRPRHYFLSSRRTILQARSG